MQRIQEDGAWQTALELYEKQREALYAGRTPRIEDGGLTVGGLCNQFLTGKLRLVESGETAPRTFAEYRGTTDRLVSTFGKDRLVDDLAAADFAGLRADAAKQWGPVRLGNEIQRCEPCSSSAMKPIWSRSQFVLVLSSRSHPARCCASTGRRTAIGYSSPPRFAR